VAPDEPDGRHAIAGIAVERRDFRLAAVIVDDVECGRVRILAVEDELRGGLRVV
jgi:hypothetical protein